MPDQVGHDVTAGHDAVVGHDVAAGHDAVVGHDVAAGHDAAAESDGSIDEFSEFGTDDEFLMVALLYSTYNLSVNAKAP